MTITDSWERRSAAPTQLVVTAGPSFRPEPRARVSRRLRLLAVVLPALFVVGVEVAGYLGLEYEVVAESLHPPVMVVLGLLSCVAIGAFAWWIFSALDRANAHLERQNRQLAAINTVATSVHGQLGVEGVVDTLSWRLLQATGAHELTVTVFGEDGEPVQDADHVLRWSAGPAVVAKPEDVRVVDLPLETGSATVGWMRLRLPASRLEDVFDADTLRSLAHVLATSVQTAQLLADLQRRNRDDFALYDLLLQVSDCRAPADVLAEVVQRARHMLSADEVLLTVNDEGRAWLHGGVAAVVPEAHRVSCIAASDTSPHDPHGDGELCTVRASEQWEESLGFAIRSQSAVVGDLWVARSTPIPFTPHDRACLEALAGIAALVITNERVRGNQQAAVVLAERERIAREMHDSLAQALGAAHLKLRAVEPKVRVAGLCHVADDIDGIADMCGDAYRDVREAILGLHDSTRRDLGFVAGVRAYLSKYSHQSGVDAELVTELPEDAGLAPGAEVQIIRVIQESLTNVRKHSGASRATVRLSHDGSRVRFSVTDNGHGFDVAATGFGRDGFGMYTMRDRIAMLGGSLAIESVPGLGTTVRAEVPTPLRHVTVVELEEGAAPRG